MYQLREDFQRRKRLDPPAVSRPDVGVAGGRAARGGGRPPGPPAERAPGLTGPAPSETRGKCVGQTAWVGSGPCAGVWEFTRVPPTSPPRYPALLGAAACSRGGPGPRGGGSQGGGPWSRAGSRRGGRGRSRSRSRRLPRGPAAPGGGRPGRVHGVGVPGDRPAAGVALRSLAQPGFCHLPSALPSLLPSFLPFYGNHT